MDVLETYQQVIEKVGGKTHSVNKYKVPKGKTLTVTEWWVGTQQIPKSTLKVALYWDANNTGAGMQLVDVIFTSKATYQKDITTKNVFTSNGKGQFVVRQWIDGKGSPRKTFVRWKGTVS